MLNDDMKVKTKSFRGFINKKTNVLRLSNRDSFNEFLSTLSGEVELTVSEVCSRTHFQNNYYWKVVIGVLISTDPLIGHTKDEMHEILKNEFKVESTSKLNVYEFRDYIDRIIRWAAVTWEIRIPEPDEED